MKLTHLLNKRIIVARLATYSGSKMAMTTVTAEMMHIQPTSGSKSQMAEGIYAKSFRVYTDGDVDVQDGDRLKDSDGNFYTVRADGVSRRTFGSFDYLIIDCEKTK